VTEHDSFYAFDATDRAVKVSFLTSGVATTPTQEITSNLSGGCRSGGSRVRIDVYPTLYEVIEAEAKVVRVVFDRRRIRYLSAATTAMSNTLVDFFRCQKDW
jgi:hypothetical protein